MQHHRRASHRMRRGSRDLTVCEVCMPNMRFLRNSASLVSLHGHRRWLHTTRASSNNELLPSDAECQAALRILLPPAQLKLDPPPRVAVLPLGTGNDLSLSFGWGNAFLPAWLRNFASVYHMLRRVADAQPRELDCWRIAMSAGEARLCIVTLTGYCSHHIATSKICHMFTHSGRWATPSAVLHADGWPWL